MRLQRFSFSDLSISYRLPLLIGTLLLGLIISSTWVSYSQVKQSALEVGRERLLGLTQQLANQLQQSLPFLLNRTSTVANEPAIRSFFKTRSETARSSAVSALHQFTAAQEPNALQVELWTIDGSPALTVPDRSPPLTNDLSVEFKQSAVEPFKAVGPIRVVNGVVVYAVLAAVKDDSGKHTGYLVRWRRASPNANVRKQLADLVGSQASLYYGNKQGDVWTDLEKSVPPRPVNVSSTPAVTQYEHEGNRVMALGRPLDGTPWFLVVEFPEQPLLIQAHRFLRRMIVVDLILFMTGIAAAFALTRTITRPLHSLTTAASEISAGNYSARVHIDRNDELGALGNAFNSMALKTHDARRDLELKIQERSLQLEAAPCAMLMVNQKGNITLVNAQVEKLFGYERNELLGQPIEMLVPERYRAAHPGHRRMFSGHPTTRVMGAGRDLYGRSKDGAEVPIEIGLNPIKIENETFVLASIIDITERKKAEERLRLVVEAAPSAMIMVNDRGRMTLVNTQTETLFGYQRDELIQQPIEILVPERFRSAHPGHRSGFLKSPSARAMGAGRDLYGRRKDGTEIPIEIGLNPIQTNEGLVVLASIIDITERKRIDDNLQRQASMFDQTYDAVIVWDLSGPITFWNRGAERVYGFERKEALGQTTNSLLQTQTEGGIDQILRDLKAETKWEGEICHTTRDGRRLIVESRMVLVREGNRSYVLEINRDITERKVADETVRIKNQELASMTQQLWQTSKLATMGELAASVAHELNNPLATVSLRLESLANQLGSDEPKLRSVEIVAKEIDRMGKLVGGLLQFSRRGHQQISTLDVPEEINNTLELIEYHLRSQNIEVVREFADTVPAIQADRQQLRQVFLNLMTNASDAMSNGGKLIVSASLEKTNGGSREVRIELTDTGAGISDTDLEKIWEPFFTTKPEGKGTGLGLAICRRVVEEHQGRISIASKMGEGTTVTMFLPATNGKEQELD